MKAAILAKKIGMTHIFDEKNNWIPVTILESNDCRVVQVKTLEKDGYNALQLGLGSVKEKNSPKPILNHFKKHNTPSKSILKEVRIQDASSPLLQKKSSDIVSVQDFQPGDAVSITAITRGKGFQGVMKRHGFKGKDATHGTHEYFRHGGSIGSNTFPGRVFKNKGMPGQTGNVQRTVKNIRIVSIAQEQHAILVHGAVPGARGTTILLKK